MTYFDACILGILQGLTEFLPVSSSGHLVLAEKLLHVQDYGVTFELVVHLGTLGSVLIYFRRRLFALVRSLYTGAMIEERRTILYLAVGTIPAGIVGFTLEDFFDRAFDSPALTSAMLIATGAILLSTRFVRSGERNVRFPSALAMGIGQALAIMPGISRSGSTIAVGLLSKVKPAEAAEFSFLLAIPAIGGAVVLKAGDFAALSSDLAGPYLCGLLVALLSGLAAVYAVLETIRRGRFEYFAYYCFAAGAVGLYLFL